MTTNNLYPVSVALIVTKYLGEDNISLLFLEKISIDPKHYTSVKYHGLEDIDFTQLNHNSSAPLYSRSLLCRVDSVVISYESELKELQNKNVKRIKFHDSFNGEVGSKIPSTVTHITFGFNFNKCIDNLPDSIIWLELGYYFDQHIKKLPLRLQYLKFGAYYNHPDKIFPNTLKYLELGSHFSQCLKGLIPNSVQYLVIGHFFAHLIKHLPASLTHLELHCVQTDLNLITKLPSTLLYLRLHCSCNTKLDLSVCRNLKHITIFDDVQIKLLLEQSDNITYKMDKSYTSFKADHKRDGCF